VEIVRDYHGQTAGRNFFSLSLSLSFLFFFISLPQFERFNFITADVRRKTNFSRSVELFSACGDFPSAARSSRGD
jgi:hypothetical protein